MTMAADHGADDERGCVKTEGRMANQAVEMLRKSRAAWDGAQLGGAYDKRGDGPCRPAPRAPLSIAGASTPVDGCPSKQSILVVESIQLIREALESILRIGWPEFEIRFFGENLLSCDGSDGAPSLILIRLRDDNACLEWLKYRETLHERFSGIPVLLVSDQDDPYRALSALRCGYAGYFPSTLSADMFRAAISLVLAGGVFCPPSVISLRFS
jgi:hypothetical protein